MHTFPGGTHANVILEKDYGGGALFQSDWEESVTLSE